MTVVTCTQCGKELPKPGEWCPACGGGDRSEAAGRDVGVQMRGAVPLQEKYETLARRAKAQVGTSRWADTGKREGSRTGEQFLTALIIFCVFFIIIYEIYFLISDK